MRSQNGSETRIMEAKRPTIKLVAATSMTIFSLFCFFVASIAWFTVSRKVTNGADSFQVTPISSALEHIYVYEQNRDSDTGIYLFNGQSSGRYDIENRKVSYTNTSRDPTKNDKVGIGTYSMQEKNNALLLLFEFSDESAKENDISFTVKANSKDSFFVSDSKYQLTASNPLTSILRLCKLQEESWTFYGHDSLSSSADVGSYSFEEIKDEGFISFSSLAYSSQDNNYRLLRDKENIEIIKKGDKAGKYIVLILDYNLENIEFLYSANIGNPMLDSTVSFFWDITFTI